MQVVKELSAEFKIKFSAETIDAFQNMLGLNLHILFAVKADFHK